MLTKTIRGKLHNLSNRKSELLEREYTAFQEALNGGVPDLYSATAQQVAKVQRQKNPRNEQPVKLRNDVIRIEERDTPLSPHWIKIPIYNPSKERGDSVWCPIQFPQKDKELLKDVDIGDSELVKRDGEWYAHLVVKTEPVIQEEYDDCLAIDMGTRWIAVTAFLSDRQTRFFGREIRQVREHYKHLRKNTGRKKVLKKWGHKESRIVEDFLHKISREIVDDAKRRNAFIAFGNLHGIRDQNNKGRRFNDKLHKFPFAKLWQFTGYKAEEEGILVVDIEEAYTSKTCNRCGSRNTSRFNQGRFVCKDCGLADNADKNGALNIGKRALGKSLGTPLSEAGAVLAQPVTLSQGLEHLSAQARSESEQGTPVVGDAL